MNHPSVFPINQDSLNIAANILLEGGVVCMPTDTFYGLAAIATNETAVEKICKESPKIKDKIFNISITKVIFVKDRIINFIIKP